MSQFQPRLRKGPAQRVRWMRLRGNWAAGCAFIALMLIGRDAVAQCNVSASIINRPGESFSPLALEVSVSGGTIGNTATINLFNSGALYVQRSEGSFGTLTRDIGLGCGFDASGEWTWKVSAVCVNFDPSLPSDDPRQSKNTFANSNGGPFIVTWTPPAMKAEILNPPDVTGNVKITWSFPESVGQGRAVWIDGGQLGLNSPEPAGEHIFNLSAGHHRVTQRWCVQSNGNAASNSFDIVVPPSAPPDDPATFRFDLPSTETVKVLIHRYGDQTYPAPLSDPYPSRLQTTDRTIKVEGSVTDSNGRPLAGKTVYFRVTDPPDQARYVPAADRVAGDNRDGPGTLSRSSAPSDGAGRASVMLTVTDHVGGDNYQVEASMKPDFTCGTGGCPKSATYTAWKRVYVEVNKMFRRGSFVRLPVAIGATQIPVTDVRSFPRPPFQVRLIHAASPDAQVAEFYSEDVQITRVVRDPDPQHDLPDAGVLIVGGTAGTARAYLDRPALLGRERPYLADAIGVVSGNRSRDYYLPNGQYMGLFDDAFVEYLWLTDATATDGDVLSGRMTAPFDGAIPYRREVSTAADLQEREWLFRKWARNVRRINQDDREAFPNHQVVFGASAEFSASSQSRRYGVTEVAAGFNDVWLFVGTMPTTRSVGEAMVHEMAHQWRVNPSGPLNSAGGHCNHITGLVPATEPAAHMWDHRDEICEMTSNLYDDADGVDDGIVGFHYLKLNGQPHSEFLTIRERAEPIPQTIPPARESLR